MVTLDMEAFFKEGWPAIEVQQSAFQSACVDLFERCKSALWDVLRDQKVSVTALVQALVIGRASRTPGVLEAFKEVPPSIPIESNNDPTEVVTMGVCILSSDDSGMADGDGRRCP